MLGDVTTLSFESRKAYTRGLGDLTDELVITMRQEWMRDDKWRARDGKSISGAEEFLYVEGEASEKQTFAGVRDQNNVGKRPHEFQKKINEKLVERAKMHNVEMWLGEFPEDAHTCPLGSSWLLTLDEVLAVRLYTGPAFQPLNQWLRNVGKLDPSLRRAMATDVSLTYAATTKHLVSAIRKIARVPHSATKEGSFLYRGIAGVLPGSFWRKDEAGFVCATDLGFMRYPRRARTSLMPSDPTARTTVSSGLRVRERLFVSCAAGLPRVQSTWRGVHKYMRMFGLLGCLHAVAYPSLQHIAR
jgi:hypothetical protein